MGPAQSRQPRVDALLVDQMEPAGASVADYLQLPYVTVCNALALNREDKSLRRSPTFHFEGVGSSRLQNKAAT